MDKVKSVVKGAMPFGRKTHQKPVDEDLARTARLRESLRGSYEVGQFDKSSRFGDGWSALSVADRRPVFIRLVPSLPQRAARIDSTGSNVFSWRDEVACGELGTACVFFDSDAEGACPLRELFHGMDQRPTESMVGALFAPIVLALQEMERGGRLTKFGSVDCTSVLAFRDGSVKVVDPGVNVHDGTMQFHKHNQLDKRRNSLLKRLGATDGTRTALDPAALRPLRPAANEREKSMEALDRVAVRYVTADLGMILYELMTRHPVAAITKTEIRNARNMLRPKRNWFTEESDGSGFSPELVHLLIGLLESGKSEKPKNTFVDRLKGRDVDEVDKERGSLMTLDDIARHVVVRRFGSDGTLKSSVVQGLVSEHLRVGQQSDSPRPQDERRAAQAEEWVDVDRDDTPGRWSSERPPHDERRVRGQEAVAAGVREQALGDAGARDARRDRILADAAHGERAGATASRQPTAQEKVAAKVQETVHEHRHDHRRGIVG